MENVFCEQKTEVGASEMAGASTSKEMPSALHATHPEGTRNVERGTWPLVAMSLTFLLLEPGRIVDPTPNDEKDENPSVPQGENPAHLTADWD